MVADVTEASYTLEDFDFHLPPELIAQQPILPREQARLLQVQGAYLQDYRIADLPQLLRAGDLLVFNDTRVLPARLLGRRGAAKIEILLHENLGNGIWRVFAKPAKRLHAGDQIIFAEDFAAKVIARDADGFVHLDFQYEPQELFFHLQNHGLMPLPPYIKRDAEGQASDRINYQTIFAAKDGAVAAPTAGLHFTPELLAQLRDAGIEQAVVTLHVGAGTFLPVRSSKITEHKMHAEWGEVTATAAETINAVRQRGGRIIAVGTTSLRVLETACGEDGLIKPYRGTTHIFLYPGKRIRSADLLLTNFHLPKSTLLMLVAAFAGFDNIHAAYRHAIAQQYRFFSYGDACLLQRE
jgi:S-adenosylmethionine:tRNA ribosyltransferase-isomerase